MYHRLAKSMHASGSANHGLQYKSICSLFSDFGQSILDLLATMTWTRPILLAAFIFSSIKWGYIGWGLVRKTLIMLGISNGEDLIQGIGYTGVRNLEE